MRILIIEDKKSLAELIADRISKEGYLVDVINDGEEGFYNASTGAYDLIILDIMLPGMDGFEILKNLRNGKVESKIIILSAKSMLNDKLKGLKNGADDYITKPFHMDELIARVDLQLKDKNWQNNGILKFRDIELNVKNSLLVCSITKQQVELVCKEMQILEYFINNNTQILSKTQIYDKVWGVDSDFMSNNLEVYLSFLRRKLKAIGSNVNIKAVRGLGYKLDFNNEKI